MVQIDDGRTAILFETEGGSVYVGQLVVIQRGPSPVATARVTHRFTREGLAGARIVDQVPDIEPPRAGDAIASFDD